MKLVANNLWRGKRPKTFKEITDNNFVDVINLESGIYEDLHDDDYEKNIKTGGGLFYYKLKCSDFLPPSREHVEKFLEIVRQGDKTFVHCLSGVDRTGFMCAVYRMRVCGWSFKQAVAEYKAEGQHFWYRWWIPFLKLHVVMT